MKYSHSDKKLRFIFLWPLLILVVFCIGCGLAFWKNNSLPLAEQQHKEWKDYGGGPDHSKYVEFKQITKANINQLKIDFVYAAGDNLSYNFNPIVVDNVMYVLARNNSLVAVDATTGKEGTARQGLSVAGPSHFGFAGNAPRKVQKGNTDGHTNVTSQTDYLFFPPFCLC